MFKTGIQSLQKKENGNNQKKSSLKLNCGNMKIENPQNFCMPSFCNPY